MICANFTKGHMPPNLSLLTVVDLWQNLHQALTKNTWSLETMLTFQICLVARKLTIYCSDLFHVIIFNFFNAIFGKNWHKQLSKFWPKSL